MAEQEWIQPVVQRTYEICSNKLRDPRVKIPVLAELIKDGLITSEDWTTANKLAIDKFITEDAQKKKRQAQQDAKMKELSKPDSRIWQLSQTLNTQPQRIQNYVMTYNPVSEVEAYLADLKERPLHYNSLYPHGKLQTVISIIEKALQDRKNEAKPAKPHKVATEPKIEYSR